MYIEIKCDNCNKYFNLPISEYNKKIKRKNKHFFCCKKCFNEFLFKNNHNKIIIYNDFVKILYTNQKKQQYEILIDKQDYERFKNNSFNAHHKKQDKTPYAYINGKPLHRLITNCPKGLVVDHINHNGLDNRRNNLRICTHKQNAQNKLLTVRNTSGALGISWSNQMNKWKVTLETNHKSYHGGYFEDIEEAKKSRKDLEKKYFSLESEV